MKATNGWYMTEIDGKAWTPVNGGRTVRLEKGVWSKELRRWLTPPEIEAQKEKERSEP